MARLQAQRCEGVGSRELSAQCARLAQCALKDFFGAVFFVSVGMMVNPAMFWEYAFPICVITFIVMVGKVAFSCFGFIVSGQPLKISVLGAFSLAQVGEFAFIIASLGMSLGVLHKQV